MADRGRPAVLIADGEGDASQHLLLWAEHGLIDVVQYDILRFGFTRWLELGARLDQLGVRSAPHHYGETTGNYTSCALAGAIQRFEFVEWDEATVSGLTGLDYSITDGRVNVPARPGFGLELDNDRYTQAVKDNGFIVE